MIEAKKSQILSGLFWKLLERGGTQAVQFIVQIVLARLLLPKDYGVIALITIFIVIANVFIQSGFNTALIQKKNADEKDFSSVFYLSLGMALILYGLFFFSAPSIARFYNEPQLTSVLRVISLTLFFGAVNSIQTAVIDRNMQFKKYFFSSLGGIILSGTIGISMAYMGFGVWALVAQNLINISTITLILWFTLKWRPKLIFSLNRLKGLFSFGWKLLLSSLIDNLYQNSYSLVVGKIYNSATLGYVNRGEQFPQILVSNINGAIQSVMLPALSAVQDDRPRIKAIVRRSIVTSTFILFPLMVGLAVSAEPLVIMIFTEKWLPIVPFLQIMSIAFAFWPIHTANLQAINALGRSDIFLKLEIIKKVLGIVVLCISIPLGVYIMVLSKLLTSLLATIINAYPNKRLLNYSYKEQIVDIIPSLSLSIIMGIGIYLIQLLNLNSGLTLAIQICSGVLIYLGLAYIFRLECFFYLLNIGREKMTKTN